ncbi:hypothetical protein EV147_2556 [Cupriavidus agavae]|uniref:Uncharacterized protein n=2 Tax=Cupriavidus agavae TaxID=1001822 RepID=A0A4Q7RZN4_9BURK|nr:hypothetical protein EV147_2556 [Cupriavidus agavae]
MVAILLLVAAFLFMAMTLPLKATIAIVVVTVVIGFVVKVVARMVTGEDPTVTEALKAVFVALLFNAIAAAAMGKLTGGSMSGISTLLTWLVTFVAFSLGFVVMLKATLKQSAVISLVSSPIAALILFASLKV